MRLHSLAELAKERTDVCSTLENGLIVSTRFGSATILLVAALLKSHQLATSGVPDHSLLPRTWMWIPVVEWEIFLGMLLIMGSRPHLAARLTAATSCVFFIVASWLWYRGDASCGCFGTLISLHPSIMTLLDALMVAANLYVCTRVRDIEASSIRESVGLASIIGGPLAVFALLNTPGPLSANGEIEEGASVVALSPTDWPGSRWPVLRWVQDIPELGHGTWRVLLYVPRCNQCRQALATFVDRSGRESKLRQRYAAINIGTETFPIAKSQGNVVYGALDPDYKWVAQVPIVIELSNGVVKSFSRDFESL